MRFVFEGISFDYSRLELEAKSGPLKVIWQNRKLILVMIIASILYPIYILIRAERTVKHWLILNHISKRIETAYWRIDYILDGVFSTFQRVLIGLLVTLISPLLEMKGVACA